MVLNALSAAATAAALALAASEPVVCPLKVIVQLPAVGAAAKAMSSTLCVTGNCV